MGSEGGIRQFNLPVHVAVGRNVKEGKSLLAWAAESFPDTSICLLHVHQPVVSASLSNGKLSASKLKTCAIKAFEKLKMQKLVNQYLLFLSQMGNQAEIVWIEMKNIQQGILQLVFEHGIRRLVMGAAPETFSTKPVGSGSHLTATITSPPSINSSVTTITRDSKEDMDSDSGKVQHFEHATRSAEGLESMVKPSASTVFQTSRYGFSSPLEAESPVILTRSSSSTSLDTEFQEKETSYQIKLKESLRLWRAEEDALEAMQQAEAAENHCKEEVNKRTEIEEQLFKQKQEMETMKNQRDQALKELHLIKDQKPALESQLREAHCSEKELEEKIIQAVNLLITFKGKRDELQRERDLAIRKINKSRAWRTEDPFGISNCHFFEIPFSEIVKATEDFSPSQKIGEGIYGSVFKGMLNHVKVAIKMLPSSGFQSDWEFKNEAEVLCRVRHPNLVTLIGVCPESRSLVYEYIENGSLEDYLLSSGKAHSLSWQTRVRIAADICSALLFLYTDSSCSVHGNLKPSNILLDGNFVTKISDFGIHNLICPNENPLSFLPFISKNDPERFAYADPEAVENGKFMFTTESDIYSFGVILACLLTARPASGVVRDVKCAVEGGRLETVLDMAAGDWPIEQAQQLAFLALRCCQKDRADRPDLVSEIRTVLEPMRELCNVHTDSRNQRKIPSHFVCPIYQEVMKDPHIAPDGFTYEGEAIKGWFNSGHKTSPMTNLNLENCDLLPNYALYYAIQEWQHNT